ncbi:MAG: hypothetical protein PF518_06390 [Spirochaetaceae bacterium]|nr:hypothetical protein [Spirochaetaceae bacterium]
MKSFILTGLVILTLRAGQDVLFLAKIDAYNRSNRVYSTIINFVEAMYGITVISIILGLMTSNIYYVIVYGFGSALGGTISSLIKGKLDNRLEGQRKFFARITLEEHIDEEDLVDELRKHDFEFMVEKQKYISGKYRTVIQGSLANRQRMNLMKDILRGRPGKHLVIMRAEDVYMIR